MGSVRIKYWVQDTLESGHWEVTGMMSIGTAKKVLNNYEEGQIVLDEEGWPPLYGRMSDG